MNQQEEELQRRIEEGNLQQFEKDDITIRAYRRVFEAAGKEPEFMLPLNFADKVVRRTMEAQEAKLLSKDHLWFGAGILLLLISFGATLFYANIKIKIDIDLGFLKHMASYKGIFVFGTLFILLLHVVDKKLIRSRQIH